MSTRRHTRAWIPFLLVADLTLLGTSFVIASRVRFGSEWLAHWREFVPAFEPRFAVYVVLVVAVFWWSGLYQVEARWSFRAVFGDIARAGVLLVGLTLSLLYLLKLEDVSRLFLASFFTFGALGATGVRLAARAIMPRLGRAQRNLLVIGSGERADAFLDRALRSPAKLRVVGYLSDQPQGLESYSWLGGLAELGRVLAHHVVDEVAICLPLEEWSKIDEAALLCEQQGKVVHIPVDVLDRAIARGRLEELDDLAVLSMSSGPDDQLLLVVKRIIDLVGAAIGLLLGAPLLGAIALAIWITEGRPVFFSQERVGRHGRRFLLWKYRTMVPDAEDDRAGLTARNERHGPAFKLSDDPRVTRLGRWLRRTSLDELPQLWNVLWADMSLVGPRPPLPDEVEDYDLWHRRRLSMKPGMTGLWQVEGRSDPDFARWVGYDLAYIDNWSLWLDVVILTRTLRSMLRLEGA